MKHSACLFKATNEQISRTIDNHIKGRNAQRDRELLKRRLIDGVTFERLAEEFELSTNHVQRVIYAREQELLLYLDM